MPEAFDFVTANPGSGGARLAGDSFVQGADTVFLPSSYLTFGPTGGPYERVDTATPLPVGVQGTVAVSGPLTDTQLRATAVPVSLASVPSHPVTGPLTNAELRATAVPVSGTVTATGPLTNTELRASAVPVSLATVPSHPVTGPLTNTELRASAVPVQPARPATATLANVAASATTVTLRASLAGRLGLTVYNDSTALLYLKLGATASTTSFTVLVAGGGYYEVPYGYTGVVDGIWASATGTARVTELS